MTAPEQEAREFARAFRRFLEWVHVEEEHGERRNEVVALVRGHLEAEALQHSVVTTRLPPFEHVNLQVALDAWTARDGRAVAVHGVVVPPHFGGVTLQMLLHGDGLPPVRLGAPELADLPSGPDRTTACLSSALLLVDDERGRWVLRVAGPQRHEEPSLVVEVAGLSTADAQAVLRELDELRSALNVYRGQLIELQPGGSIAFPRLAPTAREDVVLPEEVLRRVERHTLDVAARRADLRAAGQHLKRGLLLHGPPGTGKTHTTRYVVQHLPQTTVVLLSGRSLHMVGEVTALARDLQPAAVVLEDVDLVAEDRSYGDGPSPVLFELLDAMDGAAEDADLLFLLTTNRADLLEPALAARPGRVDVAVEIGLPEPDARRRLFGLYAAGVPLELDEDGVQEVVDRTEGVTASFVKELLRRAVLESLSEHEGPLRTVTRTHVSRALDDLLDSTSSVTRALLGVPADQSAPPAGPPAGSGMRGGHGSVGWLFSEDDASVHYSASYSAGEDHGYA